MLSTVVVGSSVLMPTGTAVDVTGSTVDAAGAAGANVDNAAGIGVTVG